MHIFRNIGEEQSLFIVPEGNGFAEIIIDKEDKGRVINFPFDWFVKEIDGRKRVVSCAVSKGKEFYVELAHLLLGIPNISEILYVNGNYFDCRKKNLKDMSFGCYIREE